MDFHTFTTLREACKRSGIPDDPEEFYQMVFADAVKMRSVRKVEVAPHYRRPHLTLVWTGRGRAVPRVVPRRGSVVHREGVEKLPSGFGE